MGLSSSSDEFCRRSDEVIKDLPGTRKLVDDILIQASSLEQLKSRISALLSRCKAHSFTLSQKKFEIGQTVTFAGYIVGNTGVFPDPKKLQGIHDFPAPKDKRTLRSFLGMVNQMSPFHPRLAELTGALQQLLKKSNEFLWCLNTIRSSRS